MDPDLLEEGWNLLSYTSADDAYKYRSMQRRCIKDATAWNRIIISLESSKWQTTLDNYNGLSTKVYIRIVLENPKINKHVQEHFSFIHKA